MDSKPHIAAIIPARGGSKGIPRKNVINFCGKPLLAWSIEQAKAAPNISNVYVSSDCDDILAVAERFGAFTVKRPLDISGDHATSESAWLHAIAEIEKNSHPIDIVVAMQATSPLRESNDLTQAILHFIQSDLDSLFSAAVLHDFFIWSKAEDNHSLHSVNYDYKNRARRQDIRKQYVENGSFYLFKPNVLRTENNRLGGKIGLWEMDFWKTFEIDNQASFRLCETLMKNYLV